MTDKQKYKKVLGHRLEKTRRWCDRLHARHHHHVEKFEEMVKARNHEQAGAHLADAYRLEVRIAALCGEIDILNSAMKNVIESEIATRAGK